MAKQVPQSEDGAAPAAWDYVTPPPKIGGMLVERFSGRPDHDVGCHRPVLVMYKPRDLRGLVATACAEAAVFLQRLDVKHGPVPEENSVDI